MGLATVDNQVLVNALRSRASRRGETRKPLHVSASALGLIDAAGSHLPTPTRKGCLGLLGLLHGQPTQ